MKNESKKAVFLDRDGTINRDVNYCRRIEDFDILPGVPEAIKLLNAQGFKVIVITNQSGIARGFFTKDTLSTIHHHMKEELVKYGAVIDGIYYCPHHPDDNCDCRKPLPKLILQAAADHGISIGLSYMIGDDPKDIEAGINAGCRTVWLKDTPASPLSPSKPAPDKITGNLLEAVKWIISDTA